MERSPREIRDKVVDGIISPEQAAKLFKEIRGEQGEIVAFNRPEPNRFNAIVKRTEQRARYVFNHQAAYDHYLDRKDVEEGIKHIVGTVAFGVTGVVDGVLEGMVYFATEVAETASYGATRTIKRIKDGAERGWHG